MAAWAWKSGRSSRSGSGRGAGSPIAAALLAALCLLAGLGPARGQSARPPRRFAFLVGINTYKSLESLTGAARDAQALGQSLSRQGWIVEVMTSDAADNPVTKDRIHKKFAELAQLVEAQDTFLFLYSGHGCQLSQGRSTESFLAMQDIDQTSGTTFRKTTLSMGELHDDLNRLKSTKRVLFLDACRTRYAPTRAAVSGPASKPGITKDFVRVLAERGGENEVNATVFACATDQFSLENPATRRGFFSEALQRAIDGTDSAARDQQQRVTLASLKGYLKNTVKQATTGVQYGPQEPVFQINEKGNGAEELVIVGPPPAPPMPPPPPTPGLDNYPAGARHALVIGIGDYGKLRPLPSARKDAEQFAALLKDRLGFPADQVTLVSAARTETADLLAALDQAAGKVADNDLFVLYLAGHGRRVSGEDFIVTPELESAPADLFAANAVSLRGLLRRLGDDLHKKKPGRVLLFTDLGGEADGVGFSADAANLPFQPTVLFANGAGEQSLALKEDPGRGLFTHFVVEGLKPDPGAVDKNTGDVSLATLREYLRSSVGSYVTEKYGAGATQTPELASLSGSFVLIRATWGHSDQNRPPRPAADPLPAFPVDRLDKRAQWLGPHTSTVQALAVSPSGSLLASASSGEILLTDLSTGKALPGLPDQAGGNRLLVFSANGKALASVGADQSIRVWRMDAPGAPAVFPGTGPVVQAVALSPDARLLAAGYANGTLRAWDLEKRSEFPALDGHKAAVSSLAFSPDGRTLLTGSADKTARLWDTQNWQSFLLAGHTDGIFRVFYTPDGTRALTASVDGTVRAWDGWTGHPTGVLDVVPTMPGAGLRYALALSGNGECLAAAPRGEVQLWNPRTGQRLVTIPVTDTIVGLALSEDGQWVTTSTEDGQVIVWATTGGTRAVEPAIYQPKNGVWPLLMSGKAGIVAGGYGERVVYWKIGPAAPPAPAPAPAPATPPTGKQTAPTTKPVPAKPAPARPVPGAKKPG